MAKDGAKARGSIWHGPGHFERPGEHPGPDLERDPTLIAGRTEVPLTGSIASAPTGPSAPVSGDAESASRPKTGKRKGRK